MKKKNGTGHSTKQLYSALFFINCVHFIDYSPLFFTSLFSNTSHFFPFFTFLCSTSSHFLPRPFFSIPIHPIFPSLYSNSLHSPSFPIPPHVFFSSKSNHVHSPKIPLLQNPKPENPFVLSQCSTSFAEPSSSFPLQKKINAHPASPKMPFFQNFRLSHFPAEFSQFSFPPHSLFPHKNKKRINPFGFILFCIPYIRICLQIPN